jgi:hypothetical protein
VGTLIIPIGAAYFENVFEKCCLPSFTNKNAGYYCQVCKYMVCAQSQLCIACKIKHVNIGIFDYMLYDPWIEQLFGHKLINLQDFKSKQGFSFAYLKKENLNANLS